MAGELIIPFVGPFCWPGTPDAPSVFGLDSGRKSGIYHWAVPLKDGHLIYYVGETGAALAQGSSSTSRSAPLRCGPFTLPQNLPAARRFSCGQAIMVRLASP
jgi:hypothetical protein